MLVSQDVDTTQLSAEKHLTKHEKQQLETILNDPVGNQDVILDHGYTGIIDASHVKNITGTVVVSLVTKRQLLLKEFRKGLDLYGFLGALDENKELCKCLFVRNAEPVDADYVVSLLNPSFAEKGSNLRHAEETVFDNFQDFVMTTEDTKITGFAEEVAWNDRDDGEAKETEKSAETQAPDLSPAGILGSLTGQKHRSVDGQKLSILVKFDHDCLKRNPAHSICFPLVGACARVITLPVVHMLSSDDFKRVMLLALYKGQAFGNR